jgi:hypothetical protein
MESQFSTEQVTLDLAGKAIRFRGSAEALTGLLVSCGHLITLNEPILEVIMVDASQIRADFKFALGPNFLPEAPFRFIFLEWPAIAVIANSDTKVTALVFKEIPLRTPDQFRTLFQALIESYPSPIHGGSVSWGERSALISNVGGSGKSSLIAACVISGAKTTGDDFGIMNYKKGEKTARIWSQFQTFKALDSSPTLKNLKAAPLYRQSGKGVYSLPDLNPNAMVKFHDIGCILIPIISSSVSIEPTTSEFAFQKIGPSSVSMAVDRQLAIFDILALCQEIPAHVLRLGPDSIENAQFLKSWLKS